jgi:pSer/pThr/pTyr-binding forkhead associated (FHA) protein
MIRCFQGIVSFSRGNRPILITILNGPNRTAGGHTSVNANIKHIQKGQDFDETAKFEAQTMVLSGRPAQASGPRLVCTNSAGKSRSFPLNKDKIVIGRSSEAHLKLVHPLISRKHCVVEKRDGSYFIRNISTTNPIIFNDHDITEKRLYAGDELKIGTFSVTFVSDRPEDVRVVKEKVITRKSRPLGSLIVLSLLLLSLGGYLIHLHVYKPWEIKQTLLSASTQIEAGRYIPAQKELKRLLSSDLSLEDTRKAKELMAQTALAITQQKAESGDLEDAKQYLIGYLAAYGAGKEAEILWDHLDYYHLLHGQRLEASKDFQSALGQYAAVRQDSRYFVEAQKAVRRIWLAYQQPSREEQTLSQLLEEAEGHFKAKRYLTPVNQNAYSVYQAVLALEPDHKLAQTRIEHIKTFYREIGEKYFKKKNWHKALTFFERYYFIDPEAPDIQKKIKICRTKLTANKKSSQNKGSQNASDQDARENREEIKRMLEESGTESTWLMQYLFEEQSGEKDSDNPW